MSESGFLTSIATRKAHRCSSCGRRIPIGARYFADEGGDIREHTNCLSYQDEPILPFGFNVSRDGFTDSGDPITKDAKVRT